MKPFSPELQIAPIGISDPTLSARSVRTSAIGETGRQGQDAMGAANLGSEEGAARREHHSARRGGAARKGGEDWS